MMGAEDKTLVCFCHWGRKNKVLPDGSISYGGGITDLVIAKTGIKYNDFVNAVFDRLGIDPSDRILHFTVKFDRSELIRLRDQESVDSLLQFNDGSAHVYASSLEEEPMSRLPSGHAKNAVFVDYPDSEPATTPVGDDENDLATQLKKAQFQSAGDSESLKKAMANTSAGDGKPQQKEAVGGDDQKSCSNSMERLNQNGAGHLEGDMQNNNSKIGTVNEQAFIQTSGGTEKVELIVNSDPEPDTIPDNTKVDDYPDPEFHGFNKHQAENFFAVDQIWACHDADFMPRFYAHIRKVSSPEFRIKLRWLEAHPEDQSERAWVREDLPVGCGKFRRGSSKYTSDRLIFSHQVQCEKDDRGLYIVYPRKGETWALFKDWDIRWSSDPKSHRKYKYEVVEILSDFVGDAGIRVGYLDKVTGFFSIFQRTRLTEVGAFFVKPKELYKFSHRIPSKMTGTEREGAPVGSFELDTACLPLNLDDIWCPGKVKEERRTAKSGTEQEYVPNILPAIPRGTRDKSRNATISLKSGDLNGIHATDGESSKLRVTPREVNIAEKKRTLMTWHSGSENPSPDFCDKCVKKSRYSSPNVPRDLSCQSDRVLNSCTKSLGLSNSFGISKNPVTLSDDKDFEVDQVWALYGQNSTSPKTYAQIKKITPAPFKLHVALLESSAVPKSAAQSVCGKFKVQSEKLQVYAPSSFSHVVKAVAIDGNRFEIYPREGDIWALYKNWKKSDLGPDKFEYEIVEVIANTKDRIEVSFMVRLHGYKSVFRSPTKSNSVSIEIQKDGFWRFSHQIPAFQLTGEKGGVLRGCWELDPASVPCSLLCDAPVIV